MKLRGGYTNYGETIGILMLHTKFPRPRGDIGNALSYDFPVRYKIVRGAHATKIMGDEPDPTLLEPFMEAARELVVADGVKAITTSCGFLAPFQKQLAVAVNIPVFASSLIQAAIPGYFQSRRSYAGPVATWTPRLVRPIAWLNWRRKLDVIPAFPSRPAGLWASSMQTAMS